MMRFKKMRIALLTATLIAFYVTCVQAADGKLGVFIEKSNAQEAEGLIPDSMMQSLKDGDFVMQTATLEWEPREYQAPWAVKSFKDNLGKYELNDKLEIVEKTNGQPPKYITGFPFPPEDIQKNDPKAAYKVMLNATGVINLYGPMNVHKEKLYFVGRNKMQRYVEFQFYGWPYTSFPDHKDLDNKSNMEKQGLISVTYPYDMAGTAMLTERYLDARQDTLYGYIPAIRRVRRMTPAGRSDAMFGSDFTRDDAGWAGFDGKVPEFEFKIIGEKQVLSEYLSEKVVKTERNEYGAWQVVPGQPDAPVYGWEKEGWKYPAWLVTNSVWVKRPVWIIEGKSKDPYYNYGKMIFYIDKETFCCAWKEIWDRSGEYWKTFRNFVTFAENEDGSFKQNLLGGHNIIDHKSDHATIVSVYVGDTMTWTTEDTKNVKQQYFTLGGFTKLQK